MVESVLTLESSNPTTVPTVADDIVNTLSFIAHVGETLVKNVTKA